MQSNLSICDAVPESITLIWETVVGSASPSDHYLVDVK